MNYPNLIKEKMQKQIPSSDKFGNFTGKYWWQKLRMFQEGL